MACLIITKGNQQGKYFQLGNRPLAGGRDPAREIQIVDPTVSRKHFLIHKRDAKHQIVEAKAKNGICVNGQACSEKLLDDGDEIHVGDCLPWQSGLNLVRLRGHSAPRGAGRAVGSDRPGPLVRAAQHPVDSYGQWRRRPARSGTRPSIAFCRLFGGCLFYGFS